MAHGDFSSDFIRRVRDEYVGSWISLAQLAEQSDTLFGQKVTVDLIKKWSATDNWEDRRRKARVLCPYCEGDITEVTSGSGPDIGYMFHYLLVRAFNEMTESDRIDPNKMREWKNLVKEAGIKPTVGKQSAMSDVDLVLEKMEKMSHGDPSSP